MRTLLAWRGLVLAGLLAVAAGSGGCDANGFCLDCADAAGTGIRDGGADGDGGRAFDAGIDAAVFDAGPGPDACSPSGDESCDGLDNDCDGEADEGDLPGEGTDCNEGLAPPCTTGLTACIDGELQCSAGAINPELEACDGIDNDCDGDVDDGNPGGGVTCGDPTGECRTGVTECDVGTGLIACLGQVLPTTETCNGRDDDCDGDADEDTGGGECGPDTELGPCEFGALTCIGGQIQCIGEVMPEVEDCDLAETSDRDCDGDPTNGFDLDADARNCGTCGTVCQVDNAFEGCAGGACFIAACQTDYWDVDLTYDTGCEFGPCEFQGAEDCNQADDDCDDTVDEDLVPPAICQTLGACAGTEAACEVGGWACNYGADVSLDGDGAIEPETQCDDIDNDCDGDVDEAFPLLGLPCDDGELGACRDGGVYECNPAGTGVECNAVDDEVGVGTETCDGSDEDCDGDTDESEGLDDLNTWVDVGAYEIFAYEASRPDAVADDQGGLEDRPCSKPDALPWTNISHDEAQTQCQAVGARLCGEAEWEAACQTTQSFTPPDYRVFEAESGTVTTPCADSWTAQTDIAGFSGASFMLVDQPSPDDNDGDAYSGITGCGGGSNCGNCSNAVRFGARLSYTVNFPTTGTWYVWVRMYATADNDNSFHAGLDNAGQNSADDMGVPNNANFPTGWVWVNSLQDSPLDRGFLTVSTTGNHTFNLFMREDGLRVDRIFLTSDPTLAPPNPGPDATTRCAWAYDENCQTYQGDACNGNDYDTDGAAAGDQDDMTATGELAACFADWGGTNRVFDMSGNVKEWTAQRIDNVNPIRGGSYNNSATGISCDFDFLTADDAFQFDNVGFRCCR